MGKMRNVTVVCRTAHNNAELLLLLFSDVKSTFLQSTYGSSVDIHRSYNSVES